MHEIILQVWYIILHEEVRTLMCDIMHEIIKYYLFNSYSSLDRCHLLILSPIHKRNDSLTSLILAKNGHLEQQIK